MYITEISIENKNKITIETTTEQESIIQLNKIIKDNPCAKIFASFMNSNKNRIGYWANFENND